MMKLCKRLVILLLVHCIVCASAFYSIAAEEPERKWTSYMRDRDSGVEYFYDKETLMKPSKELIQAWRKRVFPTRVAQKEIVTLDEIDCRAARYRALELRVTYWDGTTKTYDRAGPWANVFVNSVEEFLMDEYCK